MTRELKAIHETTGTSSDGPMFRLVLKEGHPLEGNKEVEKYLAEATDYMHKTFKEDGIWREAPMCPVDANELIMMYPGQ